MTTTEAKAMGLNNNSFSMATAVGQDGHCQPASRIVRDGHHRGTLFSWFEGQWFALDIENREYLGSCKRLAVVTLDPDSDPGAGLNQTAWGIDLDSCQGEWVIDADEIADLRDIYGEQLVIQWEQE